MAESSNAIPTIAKDLESLLISLRNVNNVIQGVQAVTKEMSSSSEEVHASMEVVMSLATDNASRTHSVADAPDLPKEAIHSRVSTIQLLNQSSANLLAALEKVNHTYMTS
ncbi:hypothetical protein [Peribacillus huizhouensis]|uniref:Methyl-accepting chemotaxis protein n=1 Tax=Peribacillus huizhouensis TaxID=1501239 RepID=A0ABR6CVF6_9BACI|nr:hypothetical protein [Peribacillus huizhouensis]MBA9028701.1 methyl-accepting chemotaxis protein [Peribacillus huizhouensis]